MRKGIIRFVSGIIPGVFTNLAFDALTNPKITKLRENELEVLNTSKKSTLDFKGFDICLYEWGGTGETILLIHGWEGQAGNFSDFIPKLLKKGYRIIAFDGPSHGFSSKGATSLFEFTELVELLIRKFNPKKLISHSFGGVATTFALGENPDIKIDKYVLLTTPDKFRERISDVSEKVGIHDKVKERLIKRVEETYDINVDKMNVSEYVKSASVKNALIIHDKNDRVIPIRQSRNVHENWDVSSFIEIEGTGHFRILRTGFVIEEVLNFLN